MFFIDNSVLRNLCTKNRSKLFNLLPVNSVLVLFSAPEKYRNGHHTYPYRQDSNILYLTGINEKIHSLWLYKDQQGFTFEYLILIEQEEKSKIYEGDFYNLDELSHISGLKNFYFYSNFDLSWLSSVLNVFTINEHWKQLPIVKEIATKVHDATELLSKVRTIKEPEEVQLIKNAVEITRLSFLNLLEQWSSFRYESDIEASITSFFIKNQVTHAFSPIIASGKNAITLHYQKNKSLLPPNHLCLIDFGCEYLGYASDVSRTLPITPPFNKRQRQLYEGVLHIQKQIESNIKPGITIKKLNEMAQEQMKNVLIDLNLINHNATLDEVKQYFPHGVAHFVGLDVHDCGNTDEPLRPGMVITCEPGIYIKSENTGIRLENIWLVDNPSVNLSYNIPIEVNEIESLIK